MNNGNGTAIGRVLSEIETRLAAIKPEQIIAPTDKREEDTHFVIMANDAIKRLFTLRNIIVNECNAIRGKGKALAKERATAIAERIGSGKTYLDILENPDILFGADASIQKAMEETMAELELIKNQFEMEENLADIVDAIFWREARLQHPDLVGKDTIGIYCDWSLCWQEDSADDSRRVQVRVVGVADIAEILGHHKH